MRGAEADRPLWFHRYYINLCQKINRGPLDCSDRASICKKSASGDVQVLGLVHTQKLDVVGTAGTVAQAAWHGRGGGVFSSARVGW